MSQLTGTAQTFSELLLLLTQSPTICPHIVLLKFFSEARNKGKNHFVRLWTIAANLPCNLAVVLVLTEHVSIADILSSVIYWIIWELLSFKHEVIKQQMANKNEKLVHFWSLRCYFGDFYHFQNQKVFSITEPSWIGSCTVIDLFSTIKVIKVLHWTLIILLCLQTSRHCGGF